MMMSSQLVGTSHLIFLKDSVDKCNCLLKAQGELMAKGDLGPGYITPIPATFPSKALPLQPCPFRDKDSGASGAPDSTRGCEPLIRSVWVVSIP